MQFGVVFAMDADRRAGSLQPEMFDRIVGTLHEAMFDESRWRETSALIDDGCAIAGSHLVIVGGSSHRDAKWLFDRAYYHGDLREEGREYAEHYFPIDERIPRLISLPDARPTPMTSLYTDAEMRTSATFNEMLRRSDAQNGMNIRMDGPMGLQIVWVLANPITAGGWSTAQVEMIERLLPHIRQFVRVRQALVAAGALGSSLGGLIENMTIGVICLDWRGKIVHATPGRAGCCAEAMLWRIAAATCMPGWRRTTRTSRESWPAPCHGPATMG